MISICLTRFLNDPWSEVVMKAFLQALSTWDKACVVEEINGYPQKKYDLIILIGTRSIIKRKLDHTRILPFCEKLIDMGDSALDPRKNFEDVYLYFNKSSKKLYAHYHYLPKFILEEYLYIEPRKDEKLNIFVDHFGCSNPSLRKESIEAINKIFTDIRDADTPMNIFYHTSKGIEINRLSPEIPKIGKSQCASYIPFEEIAKYYRKTDVFFPTHRESQGMVAQEIAACGGITVLQDWMYPKISHDQFSAMLYNQDQKIDFNFIKETLKKIDKIDIRKNALKKCGFLNFQDRLREIISKLF